jgi:carbonic anhydrase
MENYSNSDPLPKQIPTQDQLTAHFCKCFIISCMDFRLIDDLVRAMNNLGYNNNYDQFILAGASLGLTQEKFPHWGHTAMDHMEVGLNLHHFREIIIFDHMDCGAYKKFHPEISCREDEENFHHENLQKAHDMLAKKFPNMKFKAFLMEVSGDFREIKIDETNAEFDIKTIDHKKSDFLSGIGRA